LNHREKELYLREYSLLKSQGKPFFPYAVAKDSVMACVVLASIITMSIIFGAELGPKADPTTTTYVPRPEWYFFFLFEVLRVIKPPVLTPLATVGVPTVCMILLFLLPFIDRGPERRPERRPIATLAGIFTICAMAYLTYRRTRSSATFRSSTKPASSSSLSRAASPATRSATTATTARGRTCPKSATRSRGMRSCARSRTRPLRCRPSRPCRRRRRRPWSTSSRSCAASSRAHRMSAEARSGTLEEGQVRAMFDRIARVYDVMNSVMTAGLHHRWRERAADLAALGPGGRALDVACGTGDLAIELARRVGPAGEVVGADFSDAMLERAREKSADVRWEWANALDLPYPDRGFDAATVGFGARNFSDLDRGLAEMARVVRPGGRVVVLEITTPQRPPLSTFFSIWFDRVVPALGRIAGDPDAYTYLPSSVKRFPTPEPLAGRMAAVGLTDVRWILTAGGIIALHVGTVR
jgi:demethylmenaquinone methyltransferase/2-methoxy-6-polyprenyl-1,4-benzoquinol methylase